MQNRWGPSRVGPFGLLQPLADGVKFLLKEDLMPPYVDKSLYLACPGAGRDDGADLDRAGADRPVVTCSAFHSGADHRRCGSTTATDFSDINVGILVILGITSLGVYGIALAGWSSNSKYSLLGSLRASAQMVSYEVALGLSLVGVLIVSGTFSLRGIVEAQQASGTGIPKWNIFYGFQFVAFFIYMMAAFAETNRIPFDLRKRRPNSSPDITPSTAR